MSPPATVKKVAIVGTGVIGSGWAALYVAKGYTVVAYVRSPASKAKFLKTLEETWRNIFARGLTKDRDGHKAVVCVMNLAECVADADYVQESVPEDLTLKQVIIQEIDSFAPSHVIVGSSTSYIPLSLVRARAKNHPERIAIAHPSLPHWDAFCEVLGSSEEISKWLVALYSTGKTAESGCLDVVGLGMDVVELKRERHGHAFNSLLSSMISTSGELVNGGVCSMQDADKALVHLCRVILSGGGLSGAFVGMVGGGSTDAATNLAVDIVAGTPVARGAVFATRWLPKPIHGPALWLVQFFLHRPLTLLKGLLRRFTGPYFRQYFLQYHRDNESVAAFEAKAIRRVCALENLAAEEKALDLVSKTPL